MRSRQLDAAMRPKSASTRRTARPARPRVAPAQGEATSPAAGRAAQRHYWLVKAEPEVFSFDDLCAAPGRRTMWDGVRNYQARNTLRDQMRVGDEVLYYHSNSTPNAVVGIARVASRAYPDPTQFEPDHAQHDPGSDPAAPRWWLVDLEAVRALGRSVSLAELKANPALAGMLLLQRGSRLSVQPLSREHWLEVLRMAGQSGASG